MSNYTYRGFASNGRQTGGTISGQSIPLVWAATLFRRGWRALVIKFEGDEVGGICLDDQGRRVWWGEDEARAPAPTLDPDPRSAVR